jgi:predicted enzyme related to lactoylglutathione lyase
MLTGLRTVIYHVTDLKAATAWYEEMLGTAPYFNEEYYVGFNVGGFELGLDPEAEWVVAGDKSVAYWGVENAKDAYDQLLAKGASHHRPIKEVGEGIMIGSVVDPFGNILGIIENPNFGK